ncbi:MAG TPA: copper resistance system multicopper oxidase [Gammaproteobacteria bacterium]|nr:copper resistance system multicopper oxidase [Gammaproteobacteria bacterium]
MRKTIDIGARPKQPTRRQFVQGALTAGFLTSVGAWAPLRPAIAAGSTATLAGTDFELTIGETAVNITERTSVATVVNGVLPAPILRWREGERVTLRVRNELSVETSIHWHGILLPADMDGVPGISFHGIPPGGEFTYSFDVRQSGTYWYHAHSGFQEQAGLYGAIVIEPREPEPFTYDREHVVLLSDWTDRDPLDLYRLLKRQPGYFNYNDRTVGDFVRDARRDGLKQTLDERLAWSKMRMKPSDLADVGGHGYTYLMNGAPPAANWTALFEPNERVRLRFINGSAMSAFDVRIPGVEMTVVAADGQHVRPIALDEFRLSAAEVIDVIVAPSAADAFTIFAQSVDRSGYARGTLAVRDGATAPVPPLDEVQYLTMADMGHGDHAAASAAPALVPAGDENAAHADHSASPPPAAEPPAHVHDAAPAEHAGQEASAAAEHAGHDTNAAAHTGHDAVTHPPTETRNPRVDMQAMAPTARLADPGVGLRNNGRRVLTYADLRSAFADPDGRVPERTIELHLTGHMERFAWSFDGLPFSGSEPIVLRYGERVRFVLVNDTMMEHPIHLHGMWSDLEDEAGEFLVRKHTISMPPGTRRSFRVTADAPGPWAFHCHLLYHMESGMMREIRVDRATEGGDEHAAHS